MKITKKIIGNLEKCYALALLQYNDKKHILVASEKNDQCLLYDLEGNYEETVWNEPGGVMSMVQVPGTNGQLLDTHRFYSFNDVEDASIVLANPLSKNNWVVKILIKLPFVHRFDILSCNGVRYLIACTVKSGQAYPAIDSGCGPANVLHYPYGNRGILIAANREIDEIATYSIE